MNKNSFSCSRDHHAGDLLASHLGNAGVKRAFLVAGESYLPLIEGIEHQAIIELVTCRRESGAAMMATAYAKLTGKVGVAMVTRGPGATNASCAVHIAKQDSVPLILFVGQVGMKFIQREAFQEIDYIRFFNPLCKWVAEIQSPERIGEYVSRAFHEALSGRPGPVVLVLPQDMLDERISETDIISSPLQIKLPDLSPSEKDIKDFSKILSASQNPLIVCGGPHWSDESRIALQRFATRNEIAVYTAFRRQDYFDNTHHCFGGCLSTGLPSYCRDNVKKADTIILLGTRFGEITSCGYSLIDVPKPKAKLIHIYPDPGEIGRVYQPDLAIISRADAFCHRLDSVKIDKKPQWQNYRTKINSDYKKSLDEILFKGKLASAEIIKCLNASIPANAIICNGAGNYAAFLHRYYQHKVYPSQLAPISGSMGYALPAAIAAKILHADRPVISISGDGCFMMEAQEMSVVYQLGLQIIAIVIDNNSYGTIRMHQQQRTPERTPATLLVNPDFVKLAQAQNWHAVRPASISELESQLQKALQIKSDKDKKSTLIHLKTDIADVAPHVAEKPTC